MTDQPPPETNITVLLILAAVLISLSLLFSASEVAFLSMNKLRLRFLQDKKDKAALRVGKLLSHKEELLNTLLVANELVNVGVSVILTALSLELFGPAGVGIATGIATVLLLIFGEITPKTISTRHPDAIAYGLSGFVTVITRLLKPLVWLFTRISRGVLKLLGISTQKESVSFTEEEIKTLLDVGTEAGVLEKGENSLMNRVFKYTDLAAVDIMVPRRNIICVHCNDSWREVLEKAERTRLSRFPVMRKDIDDIVGVLYVKDMLFYSGKEGEFSVEKIMRPPVFVPGNTSMSAVRELLRENKQKFAIVIDEYSGTDGILTVKDISREIFGPVAKDEKSVGKARSLTISGTQEATVSGATRLTELSELLHIPLESHGNETIAGLICDRLGYIPGIGESVTEGNYLFVVTAMEGLRISQVHFVRQKSVEEESQ